MTGSSATPGGSDDRPTPGAPAPDPGPAAAAPVAGPVEPTADRPGEHDGARPDGVPWPGTAPLDAEAKAMVDSAARHSAASGEPDVDTRHLLWAATRRDRARALLTEVGVDPDELAARTAAEDRTGEPLATAAGLSPESERALLGSERISRARGAGAVGPEHLLMALAEDRESAAGRILSAARAADALVAATPAAYVGAVAGRAGTPLERRSHDLTELSRLGALDPLIGREAQLEQVLEVLTRRTKNNPVLIGEPGVGKTAIMEGLARRVVEGAVPDPIAGRRVLQLDLSGMQAKEVEAELPAVLAEIEERGEELVVYLPNLHTLIGKGSGSSDVGALLTPALSRGRLHLVASTTPEEYRRNVESVPALESRFQPVLVPEPDIDGTVEILAGLRDRYEAHHQVRITDGALLAAARLAHRYVPDRFLPDKAIDLLDRAGARTQLRSRTPTIDVRALEREAERLTRAKDEAVAGERYERALRLRDEITEVRARVDAARAERGGVPELDARVVAEILAEATGIDVDQLVHSDRIRLRALEDELRSGVVGQEEAIAVVAEAIRRSRAGLVSPNRPIGSFLFLGPGGVGKTELAKALARSLFGGVDRLVRLDLSGFTDAASAARLVGAPVGFTGPGDAGYLTEAVRRRPYCVLLLDQVDKVHGDVFSTLLKVLDQGKLVDGVGRTVDFRNTVVVLTSGVAAEILATSKGIGFGAAQHEADPDHLQNRVLTKLRERFRPEFLNRVDEIVVFRPLDVAQMRSVTRKLLEETEELLRNQDVTIDVRPAALDWLTRRGHDPVAGARRVRRTIQREVDNPLSSLLLDGDLTAGRHVSVDAGEDGLRFTVTDGPLSPDGVVDHVVSTAEVTPMDRAMDRAVGPGNPQ